MISQQWYISNSQYHEWLSTRSPVIPNYISPNFKLISLLPANPTHPDKYSEHNKPSFYYEIMIPETSHFLNTNTRYSITTIILYIILTCNASLPLKLFFFFFLIFLFCFIVQFLPTSMHYCSSKPRLNCDKEKISGKIIILTFYSFGYSPTQNWKSLWILNN